MKNLFTLLLLTSCGPAVNWEGKPIHPNDCSTASEKSTSQYKKGDIVCLVLTEQRVLVSDIPPDTPNGYYEVITDYGKSQNESTSIRLVAEFELKKCLQ